jgi:gamma-glutamylputrescine oxidase
LGFNAALGMAGSYYAATANPFAPADRLAGAVEADICIIGGGCTGLSAALHAAERGYRVVLLEGGRIGWGASGRNGGQIIPGLRGGPAKLVRMLGIDDARRLFSVAIEARDLVVDLIRRHGIACDLKTTGHIHAAAKPGHLAAMADEVRCLERVMAYPHAELLDRTALAREVATPLYHGGLLDRHGGHLHPLNYTLGLADAARAVGAQLFERSAALIIDKGSRMRIRTAAGEVRARFVVLACDAFLGGLEPRLAGRIMPVGGYLMATEPLVDADRIIPEDRAVSDTRFMVNYYRLSADRRLVFGGGERYLPHPPRDIAAFVRPFMARVFPQLANRRIDHAWGGKISVTTTRMPDFGRSGNVFHAHGYSGMGVVLTTLAGKLLAEAMAGTAERFDLFGQVAPPPFPGGTRLRYPLYVLGMLWYALRDRL